MCALPQSPGVGLASSVAELERCVTQLGFVGCNLNLDPSGGYWNAPPLGDRYWYPLYEKMVELDVPAMIHVSACENPAFYTTGSYYLNADTTAFMQLMQSQVTKDFPTIRFIIPHGGGAVPFHWGRFPRSGRHAETAAARRAAVATMCTSTPVSITRPVSICCCSVIPNKNILFASEMIGAVRGVDPETGHYFDDTRRYIDGSPISAAEKANIFEHNIRRVYPRLNRLLEAK